MDWVVSYENKLGKYQRGNSGLSEILIVLMIFALMTFGAVIYYFYAKMIELEEATSVLNSRVSEIEYELKSRREISPTEVSENRTERLEELIDPERVDSLSGNVGILNGTSDDIEMPIGTQKVVGTLKVLPDGTVLEQFAEGVTGTTGSVQGADNSSQ